MQTDKNTLAYHKFAKLLSNRAAAHSLLSAVYDSEAFKTHPKQNLMKAVRKFLTSKTPYQILKIKNVGHKGFSTLMEVFNLEVRIVPKKKERQ